MKEKRADLGQDSIMKLIWKLGLPATVAMLVNALYNLVDTIFLGHWVGKEAIAALTVAMPLQTLMMGFGLLTGVGAASMISRSLGENRVDRADLIAGNAFMSIAVIGTTLAVIGIFNLDPILRLFGASATILPYAREYMGIIFIGWVFVPMVMSANNMVRAEGDAKTAMISMLIGTGLNLLLDPLMIYVFDLGIRGAAMATVFSQFCAFLFLLRYFLRGGSIIKLGVQYLRLQMDIMWEMYAIGFSSFARQLSASVVGLIMNQALVFYGGDLALAAFGIMFRVHMFVFMPLFGVVQAMQPILGFNYGARDYHRVRDSIRITSFVVTLAASVGTLIIMVFPRLLARIFTTDVLLIEEGIRALRFTSFLIPIVGIQIVASVVYQAIGKAGPALFLALARQVILTIPLVLVLPRFFGLVGVWMVYPVADALAFAISVTMLRWEMRVLKVELGGDRVMEEGK